MKVPKQWYEPVKPATPAKKVQARIDMSDEVAGKGLCPDCHAPMEPMWAGSIPVLVCDPCRITLPVADNTDNKIDTNDLELKPYL